MGERRPGLSDEAELDRLAMTWVERLFLSRHVRLEHIVPDVGRDARLIFPDCSGGARGFSPSLQVKGTRSATTDTESGLGFKFRLDVKNILFLTDDLAPAYYLVHNVDSQTTYVRSAHEIKQWLDACDPGWKSKKTVTVTFTAKRPLSDAEIDRMAAEAEAWASEKRTTRDAVEFLEAELARYATLSSRVIDEADGAFQWARLRGGCQIRGAFDAISMTLFLSHLSHSYMLCVEFRRRTSKAIEPHETVVTGLGALDLAELTKRLSEAKVRHARLLMELDDVLGRAKPEPRAGPPEAIPRDEPGLMHPRIEDLDAAVARIEIRAYLETLGMEVVDSLSGPLELVVRCGSAVGLLSLDLFRRPATHARFQAVRRRMAAIDACAGVVLITLCQFERLQLQSWPRPSTDPRPPLPIGTFEPNMQGFIAALLRAAARSNSWPSAVGGTEIPRASMKGFSAKIPAYLLPETENTSWYQQSIVRHHLDDAVDAVALAHPISFVFSWGVERTELYMLATPEDLALLALAGPRRYRDLGGTFHCASTSPAP